MITIKLTKKEVNVLTGLLECVKDNQVCRFTYIVSLKKVLDKICSAKLNPICSSCKHYNNWTIKLDNLPDSKEKK